MDEIDEYMPLTSQTLAARLCHRPELREHLGPDHTSWQVNEVGDGNLNLVFLVEGPHGKVIVKQALPYIRLVGDSWPLPLNRAFFEYHALMRHAKYDPGSVPQIYHFDEVQALIIMEYLDEHIILRNQLIGGEQINGLGVRLGQFIARTAFRGSDLAMPIAMRKADNKLFLDNYALCNITESLVFTDPYFEAELNHHNPVLDELVAELRQNTALKAAAQAMLVKFVANSETLMHGDLHTGSVMCTKNSIRIIDPEFAAYGPMGFDLGMMLANLVMSYLSQPAHRSNAELAEYQGWIDSVIREIAAEFYREFALLWHTERTGILYPKSLFEDQGHDADVPLREKMAEIWQDAVAFCGIEMHRRILSLAHNADFETIEDTELRGQIEAQNLRAGARLIVERAKIMDIDMLLAIIQNPEEA